MKNIAIFLIALLLGSQSFAEIFQGRTSVGCRNDRSQGFTIYFNNGNIRLALNNGQKASNWELVSENENSYLFVSDKDFTVLDSELNTVLANGLRISKRLAQHADELGLKGRVDILKSGDTVASFTCKGGTVH